MIFYSAQPIKAARFVLHARVNLQLCGKLDVFIVFRRKLWYTDSHQQMITEALEI